MYVYACMSVCAHVHVGKKKLGLYMEFMFSFNASYTSHELPHHEKICFRGLRPGRRHKSGFTAKKLHVARDLNLVVRRELLPLISQLHNKNRFSYGVQGL